MAKARDSGHRSIPLVKLATTAGRNSGARQAMSFRDLVMLFYATTGRLQRLKRVVASSVGLNSAEYSIVAALYRLGPKRGIRVLRLPITCTWRRRTSPPPSESWWKPNG